MAGLAEHLSALLSLTMTVNSTILLAAGLVGFSIWRYNLTTKKRAAPYPPGPKGLPLLGNIADLPQTQPWDTFSKWGETYGSSICTPHNDLLTMAAHRGNRARQSTGTIHHHSQ